MSPIPNIIGNELMGNAPYKYSCTFLHILSMGKASFLQVSVISTNLSKARGELVEWCRPAPLDASYVLSDGNDRTGWIGPGVRYRWCQHVPYPETLSGPVLPAWINADLCQQYHLPSDTRGQMTPSSQEEHQQPGIPCGIQHRPCQHPYIVVASLHGVFTILGSESEVIKTK